GEAILKATGPSRRAIAAIFCLSLMPFAAAAQDAPAQDTAVRYPDALFGDWGGVKSGLADAGIRLKLDYVTETAWNVAGGLRAGADFTHQIGIQGVIDWDKIAGI